MGSVVGTSSDLKFTLVNQDGSALAEHEIETAYIEGSDSRIYHVFVKFADRDAVKEYTVEAKTIGVAFRVIQALAEETEGYDDAAFESFYENMKIEPYSTFIEEGESGDRTQLNRDHILGGAFLNRHFVAAHDERNFSESLVKEIDDYARLFIERPREEESHAPVVTVREREDGDEGGSSGARRKKGHDHSGESHHVNQLPEFAEFSLVDGDEFAQFDLDNLTDEFAQFNLERPESVTVDLS